ncbi:tumor necrosis factor receptor superfamily member 5 isoform X2 [Syngnathoides biaculeatus]|uniref:tumor necrosis factor receptor superfamily member 5 isoform X2 n=1 Tax=Syngnathoides biaculeatus TaxID=300417 RepID=UPI002ADDFCE7|nr:tumor necrosis factor receptor superfamily member 5 isoform X2 [Syngnathoides biaculeatus]
MDRAKCDAKDMYLSKAGRCCDRCPAGKFVRADCDHSRQTQCDDCGRERYTATRNHLTSCLLCKLCSASDNQMTEKECKADQDTVCKCVSGFYCNGHACDHCLPATSCPSGSGVKVQTSKANDTICAPCVNGTYSNVFDSHSPCQTHTRCEDLGRVLKTAGTSTADAICGEFKSDCPWLLPAGLWLGFVLTVLIVLVVLGLMCWTAKRKSHKMARPNFPPDMTRTLPVSLLGPPPQTDKTFDQCQKSDATEACQFTLLNLDESAVIGVTEHHIDLPLTLITNLSGYHNGTDVYDRNHSEPQEDEWCGT